MAPSSRATPTRPRRAYDNASRRATAQSTRARIVRAAAAEFTSKGYAATTVPAIAASAGVAVETVYRTGAGKAGLLAEAIRAAVAGSVERSRVAVEERPAVARIHDEPDPRRQLELYAATQPGIWTRVGPLLRVLDEAAPGDPDLAALQRADADQRRDGLGRFAALLAERGHLREGVSAERAADVVWTVCAQDNFERLVHDRGWTTAEYEGWVVETLAAVLLR
jgi:AcrR family transcriptional regulator